MIEANMKKMNRLAHFAVLLFACLLSSRAAANVVTLDCIHGTQPKPKRISIDTDNKRASAVNTKGEDEGSGALYSDGTDYWFTVRPSLVIKYVINRHDLSSSIQLTMPSGELVSAYKGQCTIVELPKPKI